MVSRWSGRHCLFERVLMAVRRVRAAKPRETAQNVSMAKPLFVFEKELGSQSPSEVVVVGAHGH